MLWCQTDLDYSYSPSNCCCNSVLRLDTMWPLWWQCTESISVTLIVVHMKWAEDFMMMISFMWTKKFYIDFKTMHLLLGLPSYLSSFLPFLNNNTKKTKEVGHKRFSEWKKVHVAMEPSKTTKLHGNDTTTLSHHSYILCHLPTMHTTKLSNLNPSVP